MDQEYFFAWGPHDESGIHTIEPRQHQTHKWRETLELGASKLSDCDIFDVVGRAMDEWVASSYHPVHRNCNVFANHLIEQLELEEPQTVPRWVYGMPSMCASILCAPFV